jgi:hypothetical protein
MLYNIKEKIKEILNKDISLKNDINGVYIVISEEDAEKIKNEKEISFSLLDSDTENKFYIDILSAVPLKNNNIFNKNQSISDNSSSIS